MYMKNYLKPYTECTKVESEGHLLSNTNQEPGGSHEPITPVVPPPPCPPNPSTGDPKDGSKGNAGGTKSPAKGAYFLD